MTGFFLVYYCISGFLKMQRYRIIDLSFVFMSFTSLSAPFISNFLIIVQHKYDKNYPHLLFIFPSWGKANVYSSPQDNTNHMEPME